GRAGAEAHAHRHREHAEAQRRQRGECYRQASSSSVRASSTAMRQISSIASSGLAYAPPNEPSPTRSRNDEASSGGSGNTDSFGAAGSTTSARRVHGKFSDQAAWLQTGSSRVHASDTFGPIHQSCHTTCASFMPAAHSEAAARAYELPP